jgi:hypothetical protein
MNVDRKALEARLGRSLTDQEVADLEMLANVHTIKMHGELLIARLVAMRELSLTQADLLERALQADPSSPAVALLRSLQDGAKLLSSQLDDLHRDWIGILGVPSGKAVIHSGGTLQ